MEIYNKPITKEIEQALIGDLSILWRVYSSIEGDEEFQEEYNKVKFGVKEMFDIRSIVEEDFEKKVAFKEVIIERKNNINITDFRDELDERMKIMKKTLKMCYDDDFDSQSEVDIHGYN